MNRHISSEAFRKKLRAARNGLPERQRRESAARAIARIQPMQRYRSARRVAAYFGSKGELDPMPLMHRAHAEGRQCFLPVLHPFLTGRLWFCRWCPGMKMAANRFGIPEPPITSGGLLPARQLDLVLVPLLGFDDECNRLGMGGGFYDRTFAFLRFRRHLRRPFLLGFADEAQHVPSLPAKPWDVRLDAVVTNHALMKRR